MTGKLLLDLDGTLLSGTEPINGSPGFIENLKRTGIDFLIMTNSIKSPREIGRRLKEAGMDVDEKKILNPVCAINSFITTRGIRKVYTAGSPQEVEQVEALQEREDPELVILLDFEKNNSGYSELQHIFTLMQKGIPIIAASGSPYYLKSGISRLDTGAFVRLLECAGNKTIEIFGKPSPSYFNEARTILGAEAPDIFVIGDDWQTDVQGAAASGFTPFLIRSGKYKSGDEHHVPGTACIDTLPEILEFME